MSEEMTLVKSGRSLESAGTEIASSRAIQEVQAAVIMAKKFPRDTTSALTGILEDCKRRTLAEKAAYSYPKAGQQIEGPSIRLAETIAMRYGNLDYGVVEIDKKNPIGNLPGETIMQAYCWDLETNVRSTKVFTVKHWVDRRNGGGRATSDERETYELGANMGQRRLRACILSIIPKDIIEEALNQCEQTLKGGKEPIADRIRKMVAHFKDNYQVSQEMLEKRLCHKIDATSETELIGLGKISNSLRDNMASREDFFEVIAMASQSSPDVHVQKKVLKNFAPGAENPPEPVKTDPAPSVDKDPGDLRVEIVSLSKKMNISDASLLDLCNKIFNKKPNKLTTNELQRLVSELENLSAN